jgi:hypothetical protein
MNRATWQPELAFEPPHVTQLRAVVAAAAAAEGVAEPSVMGRSRAPVIVRARHRAWRDLQARGWSLREIAIVWGCTHCAVYRALLEK